MSNGRVFPRPAKQACVCHQIFRKDVACQLAPDTSASFLTRDNCFHHFPSGKEQPQVFGPKMTCPNAVKVLTTNPTQT
eukprot:1799056-Amphidinium_carterae.1